jgi:MFS family permease
MEGLQVEPGTATKKKRAGISQAKFGAILTITALAFGSAPAIIGSTIGIMTSTPGDGGGWGLMVFMLTLITGPIGAVVALIGLVIMLTGIVRVMRVKIPAEGNPNREENLGERASAFALLAIPLLILQTILNFVLGSMKLGQAMLVSIVLSSALVTTTSAFAIYYGIKSQDQKVRLFVSIAASMSIVLAVGLGLFYWVTFSATNA